MAYMVDRRRTRNRRPRPYGRSRGHQDGHLHARIGKLERRSTADSYGQYGLRHGWYAITAADPDAAG
jgi:hypothetical protein